jgi:hypothetical protein
MDRDNIPKGVLIPDKTTVSLDTAVKDGDLRAYRHWMSPRTIS